MLRRALVLAACLAFAASGTNLFGADRSLDQYTRVVVETAKTSIYVGTVTMTMPTFTRAGSVYESSYTARVFPYFFYNESGRLTVNLPDESLRKLQQGEPVDFSGRAVRDDGSERRVEGRATPTGSNQGKLKVRVIYSKRIELIFNTTYRFPEAGADVSKESPPIARP